MIRISALQMSAFSQLAVDAFIDRTAERLQQAFPQRYLAISDNRVRESIRTGISRAASYGIVCKPDVSKFVAIMFLLCPEFDTDPQYPWAAAILNSQRDPSTKIDRLVRIAAFVLTCNPPISKG